ncbi:hypothetical protein BKA69DRAFT_240339 [Paraphysoderma sedebokerense]|nr:hypothetical protein BKA69DRAFT_240339 [Paraphysoderma sedebokerense]
MNKSNHGKPDNPTTKKDKEKSKKKQTDEVPDYFVCPITLEIMKDPVISKCGHMFDREAIMKWMKGEYDPSKTTFSRNCPVCHSPIDDSSLSPCFPIKTAIEDHLNGNTVAVQETSKPITLTNKLKDKLFKRSSSAAASSSSASPPASLSRKSEKKGLDWNVFGIGLEAEIPSPGSSSSRRKEKDRGRQSSDDFGGTSSEGHVVATWAVLEPLVYFHDNIEQH